MPKQSFSYRQFPPQSLVRGLVLFLAVPSLGTKLDNESLRIALSLRLGVPIVVEHTYVYGS